MVRNTGITQHRHHTRMLEGVDATEKAVESWRMQALSGFGEGEGGGGGENLS